MMVPSVQSRPALQARAPEVSPALRENLAAIDAAEVEVLHAQDFVDSTKHSVRNGLVTAGIGVATITGAILTMAGTAAVTPIVVTAAVVVIAGGVIAGGAPSERRAARANLQEKVDDVTRRTRELEAACARERPLNEASLRSAGGGPLSLVQHVEADPYVAVATHRYAHASDTVARNRGLLAVSRPDRFAAAPSRLQDIRSDKADLLGLTGLLGMVGTGWLGLCASSVANAPSIMLASLALAGCEWLALRYLGSKVVEPAVDRQLKHELGAEIALQEPRLDALREARDATRKAAVEHYAALMDGAAPPVPGDVVVEDGRVVIGGVSVPRTQGQP